MDQYPQSIICKVTAAVRTVKDVRRFSFYRQCNVQFGCTWKSSDADDIVWFLCRDQQSRKLRCRRSHDHAPHSAPDKRPLMHSSPHRSQFIFITESHRLVVYINILPYRIPFNKTAMWREKRSWHFVNYLPSILYLLPVTWEGLGLLPTTHACLASIRRI